MPRAFTLMTAMPPTKGHLALVQFASALATEVHVILNTQPGEPMAFQRFHALSEATAKLDSKVYVYHKHKTLPQAPEETKTPQKFWDMWVGFLREYGFREGDYIVASEEYGAELARQAGGVFFPYDFAREILPTKATSVRENPLSEFSQIIPEFQRYLRQTVTLFGAESTGKTTLSRKLAAEIDAWWIPEYARPYLEITGIELDTDKMMGIYKGQLALQFQAYRNFWNKPFIVQDTDLFSTIGYWRMHEDEYGPMPPLLVEAAKTTQSDLYIITKSNIPFESDPIRYGGDVREGSDKFWIGIAEEFNLNYEVLESADYFTRLTQAATKARSHFYDHVSLSYDRTFNG